MSEEVEFSKKNMRTLWPVKPEQHNYSDGGIYLLLYVERIFSSVDQFYWPETVNTLNETWWFPLEEVFNAGRPVLKKSIFILRLQVVLKRSALAELIRSLNGQQKTPGDPQVKSSQST